MKTQYIFINSKNRTDGTTQDFRINFGNRQIECEDDELLCITLLNFNMFRSWYDVNDTNNKLTIAGNQITLPHGNYPYKLLHQTINALYGSQVCSFNKARNTFKFSFNTPSTITFDNASYELFGFNNETYTGTTIESVNVLNPFNNIDSICLHINGVQPYRCYNLDNIEGDGMRVSDILCCMPFTTAPYDMFNYVNVNSEYKMFVFDKMIQELKFNITDFNNNPITLPDFTFTLKVETFLYQEEDEHLQTLKKLLEYTKMNFLSKRLNR